MAELLPSDELVEEPSDYGALAPGARLGRYELLVSVARGGMARVWAARLHGQRGFQKLVALKTILPHLAREKQFERMFLDEARIASGVHHPNVCEIYELGEEEHTLYLAMEWVSGDSLARLLRASGSSEAMDPRVVARVVADACAGVHAAHELTDEDGRQLGVVHRDLSPHNILLTADGVAKVADFGVAKALGQLHEATSAGQLKGKLAYMAPEQITGATVDRRSDVFSLGCVLYEATTGQRPFRGEGDHQVMHAVLKGEFPAPSTLVRGYPVELERIVQRALSPQAIIRYPTAERMRFALEEFLARGSLVTQSNVAQLLRARLGPSLEKRKDRIRQASTVGDREPMASEPPGGHTPSADSAHRSGVQQSTPRSPGVANAWGAPSPSTAMPGFQQPLPDSPTVRETVRPEAPTGVVVPATPPLGIPAMPMTPAGAFSQPPASVPGWGPPSSGQVPYTGQGRMAPPTGGPFAPHPGLPHPPASQGYGAPHYAMTPPRGSSPYGSGSVPTVPQSISSQGPISAPIPSTGRGYPPDRASQAPASNGQYAVAIGVGVLVAALIAGASVIAWQRRHVDGEARTASIGSASAASVIASVTPPPPVSREAPPAASGAGTAAIAAATELVFETTPSDAVLVVDGRELPAGTRRIPRPPAGTTTTLVVRARGKRDATRLVDYFTVSPLSVVLEEASPPPEAAPPAAPTVLPSKPVVTAPPSGVGAASAPAGGTPPRPKPVKTDPALPANPY